MTFCWACAATGISSAHARSKRWTMTCIIQSRSQGAGRRAQTKWRQIGRPNACAPPPAPCPLKKEFFRMRRLIFGILLLLVACGGEHGKTGGGAAGDKNHLVIAAMSSPTNIDSAPDVAEKWETPDDKTIVFHLNPKAKFHDGRPVKAADVKWTYDSLM